MSVNLSIKDVPDDVAERLRQRAARNHRSLQGELMAIVEQASFAEGSSALGAPAASEMGRGWTSGWKTIEQVAAEARQRFPGGTTSSVDLIREMRDTRYGDT